MRTNHESINQAHVVNEAVVNATRAVRGPIVLTATETKLVSGGAPKTFWDPQSNEVVSAAPKSYW